MHTLNPLEIMNGEVLPSLNKSSVVIIQAEFYLGKKKPTHHASALLRYAKEKGSRIVFLYTDEKARNEVVKGGVSGEFFYSESYFITCPEKVLAPQPIG
jgi:hypothetical protein